MTAETEAILWSLFLNVLLVCATKVSDINVDLMVEESVLVCRSEGLDRKPNVTWFDLRGDEIRTRVRQRHDQTFDVTSSVTRSSNTGTKCVVHTVLHRGSAVFVQDFPLIVFYNDAVLQCPAPDRPIQSLTWKFNNGPIYRQTGPDRVLDESWRPFVDAVTESNRLVLKNLSPDQEGSYSCHVRTADNGTYVTVVRLKIHLEKEMKVIFGMLIFGLCLIIILSLIVYIVLSQGDGFRDDVSKVQKLFSSSSMKPQETKKKCLEDQEV